MGCEVDVRYIQYIKCIGGSNQYCVHEIIRIQNLHNNAKTFF